MTFEELCARAEAGDEDSIFTLVEGFDRANRPMDSLKVLIHAANSGNVLARLALGGRAITGQVPQVTPAQGVALIEDCAQRGNKQAVEILAALKSMGYAAGGIEGALDMLVASAAQGSQIACHQLVLLANDRKLAGSALANASTPGIWSRLRDTIDTQALLATPDVKWLSNAPRVGVIERFLSADVCNWLIQRAAPRLQRAEVYAVERGNGRVSDVRTNSEADFTLAEYDVLIGLQWRRLALAVNLPLNQIENFSVLHYAPGQEFTDHHDFLPDLPSSQEAIEKSGNRILTFLIYLNDNYAGGETAFPLLDIKYKGHRGDALFFFNLTPEGERDPRTLHAGRAPTTGEKWLVSVFVRDKPMQPVT